MFTSSPDASTWSTPPNPISYDHPSPPKIHCDGFTKKSFSFKISLANSLSNPSKAATTLSALSLVPSPSSTFSTQALRASLASPSSNETIASLAKSTNLSLIAFAPKNIPNPNSALSSNNELAQAGPNPLWLVVYGVEGADPPQIDEHPVALAIIILSPYN